MHCHHGATSSSQPTVLVVCTECSPPQTSQNINNKIQHSHSAPQGQIQCTILQMSKRNKSRLLVALLVDLEDWGLFHCENCCLVTANYPWHECWVIQGLLTDFKMVLLCLGFRSLSTNLAAMQWMFKMNMRTYWTVSKLMLKVSAVSLVMMRRSSCAICGILSTLLGMLHMDSQSGLLSFSGSAIFQTWNTLLDSLNHYL